MTCEAMAALPRYIRCDLLTCMRAAALDSNRHIGTHVRRRNSTFLTPTSRRRRVSATMHANRVHLKSQNCGRSTRSILWLQAVDIFTRSLAKMRNILTSPSCALCACSMISRLVCTIRRYHGKVPSMGAEWISHAKPRAIAFCSSEADMCAHARVH